MSLIDQRNENIALIGQPVQISISIQFYLIFSVMNLYSFCNQIMTNFVKRDTPALLFTRFSWKKNSRKCVCIYTNCMEMSKSNKMWRMLNGLEFMINRNWSNSMKITDANRNWAIKISRLMEWFRFQQIPTESIRLVQWIHAINDFVSKNENEFGYGIW